MTIHTIEPALSVILLIAASVADVRTKTIPNKITFPAMAIGLACILISAITLHYYIALVLRLVLFVLVFLFGMTGLIGLGDIKLIMALSLLNYPIIVLITVIAACVLLILIEVLLKPRETNRKITTGIVMVMTKRITKITKDNKETVAFAPFLFFGYLITRLAVKIL